MALAFLKAALLFQWYAFLPFLLSHFSLDSREKSGYEDTTDPTPFTRSRCFVC